MNARDCLFGLHELKGIGWKTIETLFLKVKPLELVADMNADQLRQLGIPPAKAETIACGLTAAFVEERRKRYSERGIGDVTVFDPQYPDRLRHAAAPPWVLYYRGNIGLLNKDGIAIVGTRHPTPYGRRVAEHMARRLSEHSFTVISGLARGIDTYAHRGALEGSGSTIAVLGTGPDQVYPSENHRLFAQIAEEGLIVTEYPLGTPSRPGLFPQRNRLIATLSLGTLVVEAARRSGSLITADYANEESRDVFAVPGPITSESSVGTHDLIRQGAKLVTDVSDIIEEYRTFDSPLNKRPAEPDASLDEDERKVMAHLSDEPVSFDRLLELSEFSFGHLHSVLLSLHMKNKIEPLPGSLYISV